jgi:hypothetical protein
MTREILLSLIAAHFLADFVLQTNKMVSDKHGRPRRRFRGFLRHVLTHMLVSFVLLYGHWTSPVLLTALCVVLAHLAIDLLKLWLARYQKWLGRGFGLFLIDQALHLGAILAAVWLLCLSRGEKLIDPCWMGSLRSFAAGLALMSDRNKTLGLLAMAAAGIWGVGIGIRVFLQDKLPGLGGNPKMREGGFTIGVLERMIIIMALLLGQEALIGFLLAVKSIARFKKFDDDRFIEYFIIGSSLSFLAAIVTGWMARGLLLGQWM